MQPLRIGVRDDHPICGEVRDVAVDLRQQMAIVTEHDPLPQMHAELVDHGRTTSTVTVEQLRDHGPDSARSPPDLSR